MVAQRWKRNHHKTNYNCKQPSWTNQLGIDVKKTTTNKQILQATEIPKDLQNFRKSLCPPPPGCNWETTSTAIRGDGQRTRRLDLQQYIWKKSRDTKLRNWLTPNV